MKLMTGNCARCGVVREIEYRGEWCVTCCDERLRAVVTDLARVTAERDAVAHALRLALGSYNACDQCGAVAAEWWHWSKGQHDADYEDVLKAFCGACVADRKSECTPAEPADEIMAIAAVRGILGATP